MAVYNFKKESKVSIVSGTTRTDLEVYPDLSFSQTFSETSVPVKTLHQQTNMFDDAVIVKANPANFNFTVPILQSGRFDALIGLARDYNTASTEVLLRSFDIYIETNSRVYRLQNAVIESLIFQITRDTPLTVTVSGTAAKLSKHLTAIPGNRFPWTDAKRYTRVSAMSILLNGVEQSRITSVSMELRNNIEWMNNDTLQKSIDISNVSGTIYPETYVLSDRMLLGTIQQYVTDDFEDKVNTWDTNSSLQIIVGSTTNPHIRFNLPSIVFTNRLEVQDVFIQSYDFRMNSNPPTAEMLTKYTS